MGKKEGRNVLYTNVPLPAQINQSIRERKSESKKSDKKNVQRSEEEIHVNESVGGGTGTGCQTET